MRSTTPRDLRGHCSRCLFRQEVCLCSLMPRVETQTKIIIVRHVNERLSTSNTARLAALAIPNCQVLDYGGRIPFDDSSLGAAGDLLLYPGTSQAGDHRQVRRLVVLDGTWRQSRRMYCRINALRGMPTLSFKANQAVTRMRKPTHALGMSTLEAIAHALGVLEGSQQAQPLLQLHQIAVQKAASLQGKIVNATY